MSNSRENGALQMEETTPLKVEVTQAMRLVKSIEQRRIEELELTVQRLQHRLRICESPRVV